MRSRSCVLVFLICSHLTMISNARADLVLFSNFEPFGFRTDVASILETTNPRMQTGFEFSPTASGEVQSYTLALLNEDPIAAHRTLDLFLYRDSGGRIDATPAGLLDSVTLQYPLGGPAGEYSVDSRLHPIIQAGESYWLVAEVTTPEAFIWYAAAGHSELPDYIYNYPTGTPIEGLYFPANYSEDSAFRINGATAVPEPSTILMSVLGMATAILRRRP